MALKLNSILSADGSRTKREPGLTVVYDMNDYPATARCCSCGEEMALRQRWITSSAENLVWFADRFRLHVEQEHPGWRAESLKDQGLLRGTRAA
jgi:hypothetical protein